MKMSTVTGPSFISYVSEVEKDLKKNEKLAEAMNKIHQIPEKELQKRLLGGEIAIGHVNKVIRYNVHDDPARGISGTLVCTNFRLIFITAENTTYDLIELRNRLIDEHDVILNNIDSIFVEYPNKRKKLVPGSKVKDNIQRLELHCKDFRVAAFNFKLTVKGGEKGVITPLLHHAYPQTLSRLFAFDFKCEKDGREVCKIPLYRSQSDWDSELRRCRVPEKKWRISVINRKFTNMDTMSSYFVVPASLSDNDLVNAAHQYTGNRVPVWSWTDSSGCSLVRASTLRPETEQQDYENTIHSAIEKTDPHKRGLRFINVSKSCPSCLQLQQSFNKLKSMCMPATEADFWEGDSRWPSCASKWLQHVSTVLSVAKEAAKVLRIEKKSVIVQETGGPDLSSVVTSLIQLMLDPTCRTLRGFQALIQREWVVAGHPFLDRLGHLLQPTKKGKQVTSVSEDGNTTQLAPVFLLFLDCVYQLITQFPTRFECSVTFLTVLYDATRTTAFETFIFNNEKQRHKSLCSKEWRNEPYAVQEVDRVPTTKLLPIWVWGVQFNPSDLTLFNNPLYKMRTIRDYDYNIEQSNRSESGREETEPQLNGDVADAGKIDDCDIPLGARQKTSLDVNKPSDKGTNVGEKSGRTEDKGKHVIPKKEAYKTTSVGRFPKVALMPKQRSSATALPSVDAKSEDSASKPKSDSECIEDEIPDPNDLNDDINPHHGDDALHDSSRTKIRTRFSLRRKKKGSLESDEVSSHDVPIYRIRLQDKTVQSQTSRQNGSKSLAEALYPTTNIASLKLWRQCYFRWIPWCQIYGGGPASMLQQESLLYDEIHVLHRKLQLLKQQVCGHSTDHQSANGGKDEHAVSGVFFNHATEDKSSVFEVGTMESSSQNSLNVLPSYFPYSPVKDLRNRSVLGTPMSNFLQGGSIFNFGRRAKHSRSPSNFSITHSLSQSIEDLSSLTETDGTDSVSPATKSLEDLTSDGTQESGIRDRTQSDVPGRKRLNLLEPGAVRHQIITPPTSPVKEDITYVTSL